jgi:hypothetical protein
MDGGFTNKQLTSFPKYATLAMPQNNPTSTTPVSIFMRMRSYQKKLAPAFQIVSMDETARLVQVPHNTGLHHVMFDTSYHLHPKVF